MNPPKRNTGETMQKAGSRKRISLSKYPTYEAALAAKQAERRYPQEQLQIRKRKSGSQFDLMARITVSSTTTKNSTENE